MEQHSERAHALLSASGAHRWMNCLPSAKLEEQFPDTTSEAAREGTLAHEICEAKAMGMLGRITEDVESRFLEEHRQNELYQPEMEGYTDAYVEFIHNEMIGYEVEPYVALEKRVNLSKYIPEGFGSVDCVMIGGDTIEVIDFKYGKGVPVSAEYNPQMMLYALGAFEAYRILYRFDRVKMTIYQPRIDNTNSWECSLAELLAFGEDVKRAAAIAYEGGGDYVPGDHCKFCRARAVCRARANHSIQLAFDDNFGKDKALLNNDEIGKYLELGESVAKWVESLKEHALSECLAGRDVAGYKAVAGRSSRVFDDTDAAMADLIDGGIDEAMLYERKPLTLAKIEKALGKKTFNELVGERVIKSEGKPTLVPESDKREAINSLEKAFG